ncbi:MAG: hypothetical protein WD825_07500 [Gemmatimonadaceae bacterium]
MRFRTSLLIAALALPTVPQPGSGQSLDLTINNTGLSIGDSRFVRGIRLNFRDSDLQRVEGINATIWSPYPGSRGVVQGLALGLPVTGARRIEGAGMGLFGVGTESEFTGLGIGGFGVGAGGDARGILVGGFGVGTGGDLTGLTIGGFGAGAGGRVRGITIGGFGAGAGGGIEGITIAGFGAGSGGDIRGVTIAGFGAGGGGDITGLQLAGFGVGGGGRVKGISMALIGVGGGSSVTGFQFGGIGVGGGGDVTGISIAGIGVGAGGTLRGLAVGGVGVGAPSIRGIVIASSAGGHDVRGGVLAPVYFRIESQEDGDLGLMRGISASAFNHIKGEHRGLSIGLLNYAWELRGWQVGVLNYAANNPKGLRLLPLFNREW